MGEMPFKIHDPLEVVSKCYAKYRVQWQYTHNPNVDEEKYKATISLSYMQSRESYWKR